MFDFKLCLSLVFNSKNKNCKTVLIFFIFIAGDVLTFDFHNVATCDLRVRRRRLPPTVDGAGGKGGQTPQRGLAPSPNVAPGVGDAAWGAQSTHPALRGVYNLLEQGEGACAMHKFTYKMY